MKEVDTMANSVEKKITKRDRFNELLGIPAVAENDDLVEFIKHEIELLDKKNTAERKPTAKQVANEGYKEAIVGWMEPDRLYLAAEIAKGCPAIVENGVTAGTVTALLTQLYKAGKIVRTEDKRKNYYSLAE
jgi:hypothetical protein